MITQNQVYMNSIEKGWWEEDWSFPRKIGLIHSEISEVLEELRKNVSITEIYYGKNNKPEGVPIELADIIIRIMDIAEHFKFNVDKLLSNVSYNCINFSNDITIPIISLHDLLPNIPVDGISFSIKEHSQSLQNVVYQINQICLKFKINLQEAIEIKHKYNLTRLYKHGKKF